MIRFLAFALAIATGVDVRRLVILGAAVLVPVPAAAVMALYWWRARPRADLSPVLFCEGIAAELRSGASMRHAVAVAGQAVDAQDIATAAHAGEPWGWIAESAARAFPPIGQELRVILSGPSERGGPLADLFDELGSLALAQVEVAQEVASAAAPARATAAVLLLMPAVAIAYAGSRGGLAPYLQTPAQRVVVLAGIALTGAGIAVGLMLMRGAR